MLDINERTHKKETAEFISACQVFEIFSIIGLVAFIAGALFLIWETIFNADSVSAATEYFQYNMLYRYMYSPEVFSSHFRKAKGRRNAIQI